MQCGGDRLSRIFWIDVKKARTPDQTYAIAHELGHAFGLPDSADEGLYPNEDYFRHSFMHNAKPPHMGMLAEDREFLKKSLFFRDRGPQPG